MAAVPVTITGVLFDKHNRTQQLVTLMGELSLTGVGVGGGPIFPPDQGGGGGSPPGIWGGGNVPMPTPPIANVPGAPGWTPPGGGDGKPPGIWGPNDPRPTPPIAFPPGWEGGVPPGGWPKPPSPEHAFEWHTAWTATTGWMVIGIPQFPVPGPSSGAGHGTGTAAAGAPPAKK